MKIFNWVHRRFHHKDGCDQSVKKPEFVKNDSDTQALLERVILMDVFDGWKDGILTIGTLGLDTSKNINYQELECQGIEDNEEEDGDRKECFVDEEEDEKSDMEVESEVDPLVVTACKHAFGMDTTSPKCDENDAKAEVIMAVDGSTPHSRQLHFNSNNEYGEKKKRGERTTLADLFSADSDAKTKPEHCKAQPNQSTKVHILHEKKCPRFSKKGISRNGGDLHPMKKLRGLMKKMLNKKIHPDLGNEILKKDGRMKSCALELCNGKVGAIDESTAYLLRTQDPSYCNGSHTAPWEASIPSYAMV